MRQWIRSRKNRSLRSAIRLVIATLILLQQIWLAVIVRGAFQDRMDQAGALQLSLLARTSTSSDHSRKSSTWPPGNFSFTDHNSTLLTAPGRFLVFRHVFTGQGAGNVVSGLLATHLLGSEFNRTVCLDYPSFQKAFTYRTRSQYQRCQKIQQNYPQQPDNIHTNFIKTTPIDNNCSGVSANGSQRKSRIRQQFFKSE